MNGEFSAMNVVNAEKEKQTFLRSKNVYGPLVQPQGKRGVNTTLTRDFDFAYNGRCSPQRR